MYPRPDDFDMLLESAQKAWSEWVNQVAVIGFNSGNYDINMIKQYFVERIAEDINEKIKVAKKDNNYYVLDYTKVQISWYQEFSRSRDELCQVVQVFGVQAGKTGVSLWIVDGLWQTQSRRACSTRALL